MRFGRVGPAGAEVPAALDGDTWRDLRSVTKEVDGEFLGRQGEVDWAEVLGGLPPLEPGRIGAPIARPGKVVCIGLNYRDHAAESGMDIPAEPVLFMKDPATVVGPDDQVLIPRESVKTDWEVELAVVIGRTARYLPDEQAALDCVAGYAIANDVSEREFQLERGGQWDKGKSCETFNPLGPVLVTADEVADPGNLNLRLWVNGELRQDGTTADMVFGVGHIIHYLSQFMVLHPGDVVNTGTPAGVAMGLPGQPYLRAGDVMELEIEGLGRQRQELVQA
ncbi:fumarylacetoacetate hydrolase family protein [Pseudactinotalea sp. Z1748]|uniref:fumarylacetoacetate hydrolase family protein n=1 Tax=Pseudactinotalea sp. Z1748 TaxID=3413027 RepID=UPI003C7A04D3